MPRKVAYFDTQAQAASVLKLDVYELREAKAAGCPAFRSGRVYAGELLPWLVEWRRQRAAQSNSKSTVSMTNHDPGQQAQEDDELPKSHWDRKKRVSITSARFISSKSRKKTIFGPRKSQSLLVRCWLVFGRRLTCSPAAPPVGSSGSVTSMTSKPNCRLRSTRFSGHSVAASIWRTAPKVVAKLFSDRDAQFREELVRACDQVFQEIGRESLSDLLQRSLPVM